MNHLVQHKAELRPSQHEMALDSSLQRGTLSVIIFFSNFHFNNISTNYNYTSHYIRQCTIGCHSGTKIKKKSSVLEKKSLANY